MKLFAGIVAFSMAIAPLASWADIAALEAQAKKEGDITWYAAHYTSEASEELGAGFTKLYGIKVNVVRTTTQVAYQRVLQDIRNNQTICDIFSTTDLGHFVRLKAEGRLEKYTPENTPKVSESFRNLDPDGYYHTTAVGLVLISYNTDKVTAEASPKSWTDLLDARWKGRMSTGHPGFSGFVGSWALMMKKLYTWDYFTRLEKNKPLIGRSIADTVTALSSGERLVAAAANSTLYATSRGAPIALNYPTDGSVVIVSPSAIMKGTKRPNGARLFMEYLYSVEASEIVVKHFGIPMRDEVAPPKGALPMNKIKTLQPTVAESVDGMAGILEEWRDTFGN